MRITAMGKSQLMILIKRKILPDDIDILYQQLGEELKRDTGLVDLKIPNIIEARYFNSIPLLVQFVSTWAHHTRAGRLHTDILNSEQEDTFEKWCKSDLHFITLLLSWDRKILSNEGDNIKFRFKRFIDERLESMKNIQAIQGNDAIFTCVDDYNDEIGLLRHFYTSEKELLGRGDITKSYFTNSVLKNVIKFGTTAVPAIRSIAEDCQSIIYELFENTHYWARTSYDDLTSIYPSVRGLLIKFHRYKEQALKEGISENQFYNKYFQQKDFKPNPQGELYFLEFTIFDCGDGLVQRYIGKESANLTAEEKIDIIKKCLWKGFSSEKGYSNYERGNGLFLLCSILNKRGFMRIRTDNVDLFRDFKNSPFDEELQKFQENPRENYKSIKLFDWKTGNRDSSTNQQMSGTLITIVYPLEYKPYIKDFTNPEQTTLFDE